MKVKKILVFLLLCFVVLTCFSCRFVDAILGTDFSVEEDDANDKTYSVEEIQEETNDFSVGDVLSFGKYDNESIEWLVLDKKENKALVISRDVLFSKPYNFDDTSVTWETCTLRSYLNYGFYNTAFSEEEKKLITNSKIENPDNPDYGTEGGNDTEDYIFLLSIEEANMYFKTDEDRSCGEEWWLRSPGCSQDSAAYVLYDGGIFSGNGDYYYVNVDRDYGVRPALWLDLNQ